MGNGDRVDENIPLLSGLSGPVVNGNGYDATQSTNRMALEAQAFAEFRLGRAALFAGEAGGLRDVSMERDFKTGFNAHGWDEFSDQAPGAKEQPFSERLKSRRLQINATCIGCHRFPGVYSFNSFYGMFPGHLRSDLRRQEEGGGDVPKANGLTASTVRQVEQAAVKWKEEQAGWKALRMLLPQK